jgi:uroporphyrinogen-III synthase
MTRVWITRSEPGASVVAQKLEQHGISTWLAPVLEVVPMVPWRALINDAEAGAMAECLEPKPALVIALSAHAVRVAVDADLLGYADTATYLAVGEQTAAVLKDQGIDALVPRISSSEGLLQTDEVQAVDADSTVWMLAGVGGRDLVARYLRDIVAARVVKFELYQRQSVVVGAIEPQALDVIVTSSQQAVAAVAEQWRAAQGSFAVPLIVPSVRVAELAAEMGFANVHTAQNASAGETLVILEQLIETL